MAEPERRPLFRQTALQHYMQRQEQDILPRMITPPVFLCCWLVLALLLLMSLFAWWQEIPIFASGSAVVVPVDAPSPSSAQSSALLLFLPAHYAKQIHPGDPCHIDRDGTSPYLPCTITAILPGFPQPETLQTRYHLASRLTHELNAPMLVVEARLQAPSEVTMTANGPVQAQVQIGTRRLLTLLPGFDRFA